MNLKELTIEGYKSIGKITISNPNPFTVFVGPNASGKSNIFEAIEFLELCDFMNVSEVSKLFGGNDSIRNKSHNLENNQKIQFYLNYGEWESSINLFPSKTTDNFLSTLFHYGTTNRLPEREGVNSTKKDYWKLPEYRHFTNHTRLFIGQPSRLKKIDDSRISTYEYKQSNIEKVLKRILKDENKREEIFEILQLLIPGFERVEIVSSELSGTDTLIVYETALKKPLTKELISDGTYNILAIIAALYQSDEPQFLCIEEPENGLNPLVVKELVTIIRNRCKEKGHYIWLNTHSQTIVSQLKAEEIILVDKIDGLTQIKPIKDKDLHGLPMDEALFTNVLGGGIPW